VYRVIATPPRVAYRVFSRQTRNTDIGCSDDEPPSDRDTLCFLRRSIVRVTAEMRVILICLSTNLLPREESWRREVSVVESFRGTLD